MAAKVVGQNHAIAALVLGGIELVFGLIIIICSFVLGGKLGNASTTLTPYWAGIPYMIPGIIGIVTGITKNYCAMIAFMILNILCFIIDGVASILIFIVIGIWAAVVDAVTNKCSWSNGLCKCVYQTSTYYYKVDSCATLKTIVGLMWAIAIFAVISTLVSLAASILGCIATCCSTSEPRTVIVQQPVMMQQPVVFQNTTQWVPPPNYPQKY